MSEIPEIWSESFLGTRTIPDRGFCAVERFIFTCGLLTDVTFDGLTYDYRARYCYPLASDAMKALITWDGEGDPPGHWIKEKVSGRHGPKED